MRDVFKNTKSFLNQRAFNGIFKILSKRPYNNFIENYKTI